MGYGKDISLLVLLVVTIFGVIITVLALQDMPGQAASWSTVGQNIAPFILLISFLGAIVFLMVKK